MMTNRLDLFQPEKNELAIPAGGAFAFIEGRLCPYLEVVEIVQDGTGDYGSARLMYNPAEDLEHRRLNVEEIEGEIGTGRPVVIKWLYNNLYPTGGSDGIVIFAGQVEGIETTLGPDGENLEIVARDFSATLERISVFGRWVRDADGQIIFVAEAKTIFNENGITNAADKLLEHSGSRVRLFAAEGTGAKLWDFADAIRYLLCEHLPAGQLTIPEASRLRAIDAGGAIDDLDVTGVSLLEAIERCCENAGVGFKFVPRLSETGPNQSIVFYRKGTGPLNPSGAGRTVELNLQMNNERLSVSRTNLWKVKAVRSAEIETFDVQTPYIGFGFEVGDTIEANPDSRDVLATRNNRNMAVVERVRMDFAKQTTELKVVRKKY
jgi:hypothetical protein